MNGSRKLRSGRLGKRLLGQARHSDTTVQYLDAPGTGWRRKNYPRLCTNLPLPKLPPHSGDKS